MNYFIVNGEVKVAEHIDFVTKITREYAIALIGEHRLQDRELDFIVGPRIIKSTGKKL